MSLLSHAAPTRPPADRLMVAIVAAFVLAFLLVCALLGEGSLAEFRAPLRADARPDRGRLLRRALLRLPPDRGAVDPRRPRRPARAQLESRRARRVPDPEGRGAGGGRLVDADRPHRRRARGGG